MNVLLLSANFHPEKTGISVTATDCARFLRELGHSVTVLAAMPYYPEWVIRPEYKRKLFVTEAIDGVTIKRVWLYVPRSPSPIKRIFHELSFSFLSLIRGLVQSFDLVLCISPPLTSGLVAAALSALRFKRLWFYVKDIQPDAAIELGMLRNKSLIRFLYRVERFIYERSERILVLSEGMRKNLRSKGVPDEKLFIVPDSIEVRDLARQRKSGRNFWSRYGLESKFIALYSGNLGVKQDPTILVECARRLQAQPDVFIAVVGQGAMREEVERRIAEYGLSNVAVFPLCERSELGFMLKSADVLLAPQRREVVDFVMPSKLLAYFTSGRPVIAAAHSESEIARILSAFEAGLLVEPENADALASAIIRMKRRRTEARKMGEKGYSYVESHHSHDFVKSHFYQPLFGGSRQ